MSTATSVGGGGREGSGRRGREGRGEEGERESSGGDLCWCGFYYRKQVQQLAEENERKGQETAEAIQQR